ncbi:MAG: PilN domain-containing protein [Gammaproteobacteria bacterium]|nr:PilN domain-containing protein [Gammaproteobacteria bacterium]MDH3857308.1 PilN domain-containing protein [Gammaproteobacteria bacterium]
MNEIDLFPEDFRKRLVFIRWFRLTGYAIVVLSVVSLVAFVLLREANAHIDEQIRHFQSQREITNANRRELELLNQQKSDLKQQLDLLTGLRSGASAEQMFLMIDRSLPGPEVWLTNWKFRRAGTPVEDSQEAVNTGYFIVIADDKKAKQEETWKIETNMSIQGQALDHVAMSRFVLNLTQQPEIENVRIVNSRQTKVNQVKLVDFSLDIVVSARQGRS